MDPTAQQALMMAAIGAFGTAFGLAISYLKDRDKLKYDVKLAALEAQNCTQAEQIARLTASQEECEKQHKECEEKHETTELRLKDVEIALAQLKK